MPALFAYLIALCLLLSGGYGALNWLAAPEPVKVVAKAKNKSKGAVEPAWAPSELSGASNEAAAPEPPSSISTYRATPKVNAALVDEASQGNATLPEPVQASSSANPEAALEIGKLVSEQAKRQAGLSTSLPVGVSTASPNVRSSKRQLPRDTSNRPGKRAPVLMTLRTIEFSDGRRKTLLIPLRRAENALAFQQFN